MNEPFYTHQFDSHLANAGGPMFIGQELVVALVEATIPPIPEGMMLRVEFTVVEDDDT